MTTCLYLCVCMKLPVMLYSCWGLFLSLSHPSLLQKSFVHLILVSEHLCLCSFVVLSYWHSYNLLLSGSYLAYEHLPCKHVSFVCIWSIWWYQWLFIAFVAQRICVHSYTSLHLCCELSQEFWKKKCERYFPRCFIWCGVTPLLRIPFGLGFCNGYLWVCSLVVILCFRPVSGERTKKVCDKTKKVQKCIILQK